MEKDRVDFLRRCMETVCPSGFEESISRVWREEADRFADRTWVDMHGNSFAVVNEGGSPRVMLAGHADEIGLMITYIDENGYLSFTGIGGWDTQVLPGQRVRVQGKDGPVLGVIGRKPIHLLESEEQKKVVKFENMWIDIGAKDKDEASSLVEIGDPAVIDYGFAELRNNLVVARGFDDRVGAFVVLEAARLLAAMNRRRQSTRWPRCRRRSVCAGHVRAPLGSIPKWGSLLMSGLPPTPREWGRRRRRSAR